MADLAQVLLRQLALEHIYLGIGDEGALHPGHQLDALGAGVGPLVELAGQGLHRQQGAGLGGLGEGLVIDHVHLGLGEHDALGLLIDGGVDLVGVVAVQDGHGGQSGHAELLPQGLAQPLGLHVEAGLLLGITAVNTHFYLSSRRPHTNGGSPA